jgi:hypothetical protein
MKDKLREKEMFKPIKLPLIRRTFPTLLVGAAAVSEDDIKLIKSIKTVSEAVLNMRHDNVHVKKHCKEILYKREGLTDNDINKIRKMMEGGVVGVQAMGKPVGVTYAMRFIYENKEEEK